MGKYVKVTIQGEMFKGDKLPLAVEAMLNDVGAASVKAMRDITKKYKNEKVIVKFGSNEKSN